MVFVLAWAYCFVMLGLAVVGLHFVYRWRGSDLGLTTCGKEVALALFASASQAGLFWVFWSFNAHFGWHQHALSVALVALCYKAGHLTEMDYLEPAVIAVVQRALILAGLLAIGVTSGHIWPAYP